MSSLYIVSIIQPGPMAPFIAVTVARCQISSIVEGGMEGFVVIFSCGFEGFWGREVDAEEGSREQHLQRMKY